MHMSACLAKTLGPEMQVNVVAPGFVAETSWNVGRPNLDKVAENMAKSAPLKRVGYPDDIVDAVLFLATRAGFVTGEVLLVDGGRTLVQ